MRAFARLYATIDETNATGEKVAALVEYFRRVPAADAAWAVHFLSGRRPKRLVGSRKLATWASAEAGLPQWLFEESYQAVGDLAETITLILPDTGASSDLPLSFWVEQRLLPLRGEPVGRRANYPPRPFAWRRSSGQIWRDLLFPPLRPNPSSVPGS